MAQGLVGLTLGTQLSQAAKQQTRGLVGLTLGTQLSQAANWQTQARVVTLLAHACAQTFGACSLVMRKEEAFGICQCGLLSWSYLGPEALWSLYSSVGL